MITLETVKFEKELEGKLVSALRLGFGEGNKALGAEFEKALQNIAFEAVAIIPAIVDVNTKRHYKESLDIVGNILASGIYPDQNLYDGIIASFKPFSTSYAKYKARYYPQTAGLFWKRGGNDWEMGGKDPERLERAFRKAAGYWKGNVTRSRTITKQLGSGYSQGRRRYNFYVGIELPAISNKYMDKVFREAYVSMSIRGSLSKVNGAYSSGDIDPKNNPLDRLAINESGAHGRPFIVDIMQRRGQQLRALLAHRIREVQ